MTTNDTTGTASPPHVDADTVAAMLCAGDPLPTGTITLDGAVGLHPSGCTNCERAH